MPQIEDLESNTDSNSSTQKKIFDIDALQKEVHNLANTSLSKSNEKKALDEEKLEELCGSWLELSVYHDLEEDLKEIKNQLGELAAEQNQTINKESKPNSDWKLVDFFAWSKALKDSHITNLDLSDNHLDKLTADERATIFKGLENSNLAELSLKWNNLFELTEKEWTAFFKSLGSSNLTKLDLGSNLFCDLSINQWKAIFNGLKDSGVTKLSLDLNYLNQLNEETWNAFEKGLKGSGVIQLDVINNKLTDEKTNNLQKILEYNFLRTKSLKDICAYTIGKQCSFFAQSNSEKSKTAEKSSKDCVKENSLTDGFPKYTIDIIKDLPNQFGLKSKP